MDRSLLARATDNSDAPTPGYMYNDIAKNAATSPSTCVDVAKYLTGRLASKNNHNIKFKCLKVISKTATSPYLRGQFKRCLAQDPHSMAAIKDALQFRGPPDPVRGDQPYEKVRTAAKEALDAIYSETQESAPPAFSTSAASSYGASPHSQGGYGGDGGGYGGGPRRMEGIGNPMFKDPRLEPQTTGIANMTINEVASEAKATIVGMIKDPLARNVDVQIQNREGSVPRPGGGYQGASGGFGGGGGYQPSTYNYPPGRNELVHQTNGEWTMKSNRGPDAMQPPPNYANDSNYYKSRDNSSYDWAKKGSPVGGGVGDSWAATAPAPHQAAPSISVNQGPSVVPHLSGNGGTAVSDGSYEKQLIMELCPPGGMKPEPPSDKLAQFVRTVSSLNSDLVCPVLLDCLEEGQPWIIRAKALWVMLACIQHGKKPGAPSNAYADFFRECHGEIAPLANHNRTAIKDPAKRVLNSLGVATAAQGVSAAPVAAPPGAAAPAPPPVAVPVPNLLDFDEPPAPPAAPPPPPTEAPPAAPAAGGDSLFGGLNVSGAPPSQPPPAPPAPAAPPAANLLDGLTTAPAPAAAGGASLFGDMTVKAPAPSAATVPSTPPAAAAPVAQTTSVFDNMTMKGEPKAEDSATAMPATSGSAFGFINASSSSDSTTEKKTDTVPAANSRDTFDPLKNMTPNTAKQMMQLSPQQMQAMAYQQMMMQQQMQMQMMMQQQQQQKRGSGTMGFMPMQGNMNIMQNPAASKASMAFMENPMKKQDPSFDFIKDTMTMEKKK